MPVQRPYNPNAKLMAEMLQSDWKNIGLNVKIVSYEWGEYLKRAKGGEQQAMLIGWSGDNGDPDNWLGVLFGCDAVNGNNFSKFCYKPFEDLIKEAKSTADQGKTHRAVQAGATHPQRPSPLYTYRTLDGVPTHERQGAGLQDQPVRLELLLRRQRQQVRLREDGVLGRCLRLPARIAGIVRNPFAVTRKRMTAAQSFPTAL